MSRDGGDILGRRRAEERVSSCSSTAGEEERFCAGVVIPHMSDSKQRFGTISAQLRQHLGRAHPMQDKLCQDLVPAPLTNNAVYFTHVVLVVSKEG